jgi:hypothetical protein
MEIDTQPEMLLAETCSVFQVKETACFETAIDCKYTEEATKFDKDLQKGTCSSQGYTVKGKEESKTVPVLGKLAITEYTKPAMDFVKGGTLKLNWKDCGDASTHGKVSGLKPDTLTLGQKTTVTGSGNVNQQVHGGALAIQMKAGIISKTFNGEVCSPKTFHLPLGTGSITWDGLKCPVAAGAVDVPTEISLSGSLPASLAKAEITIQATAPSGDKLLCMEIDTQPESQLAVVIV